MRLVGNYILENLLSIRHRSGKNLLPLNGMRYLEAEFLFLHKEYVIVEKAVNYSTNGITDQVSTSACRKGHITMNRRIIIAADLVPTKSNYRLFNNGDKGALLGNDLVKTLEQADFVAMNLETPLCDELSPIIKCGPCLSAPISTIIGIKEINSCFYTLANNHIMDQGHKGLRSTIKTLSENKIGFAGAGNNIKEAKQPYISEINGKIIGFYCCAEHEFSIADENTPGANPFDPLESFEHIKLLKKKCDYIVVLYHGGKEHYRYPSPKLQKVFHKLADSGANLIIAQHTHCIGCYEEYNGSTLVYGQGNFLFDNSNNEYWRTSLLVCMDLEADKFKISFVPIIKVNNVVRQAGETEGKAILAEFEERSNNIKKYGFIREAYEKYALEMEKEYLLRLHGKKARSLMMRILNKLTNYKYISFLYPAKSRPVIRNVIECEAHNELAIAIMNSKITDSK